LLLVYVVVLTYTDAAAGGILPGSDEDADRKETRWERWS